jgi:hypothetical protein
MLAVIAIGVSRDTAAICSARRTPASGSSMLADCARREIAVSVVASEIVASIILRIRTLTQGHVIAHKPGRANI